MSEYEYSKEEMTRNIAKQVPQPLNQFFLFSCPAYLDHQDKVSHEG